MLRQARLAAADGQPIVLIGPDGRVLEKYEGQQTDLMRRIAPRLGRDPGRP